MNERDSEEVAHSLLSRGYERALHESEADVILLNTCSVRDMADQKAIGKMGMLGRIAKERPHVVFGFLGCMAQARGAALLDQVPHVDLVIGTQKFHRVVDYVDEALNRKLERRMDDERWTIVDIDEEPGSQETIRHQTVETRQATAFVSIMQGCNMHCTFCIVPQTRGSERSRTIPEIVSEVRSLVAQGVKEVTLLGQIVNLYGRHEFPALDGKSPFVQLLEAVHDVDGLERLRFTSPHPIGFRGDLIDAFLRLPKLVEHVHLPLQSGSDRILKAMHRVYTVDKYRLLVDRLRENRPDIALTTDLIVAFPGETENEFLETCRVVEQIDFDNAFVFRYSPRRDTPAAAMDQQLNEETKERRNQDLLAIVDKSARARSAVLVGQTVEVLCEGPSKTNHDLLSGRTRTNKIVIFDGKDDCIGRLVDVEIRHSNGFSLHGNLVAPVSPALTASL